MGPLALLIGAGVWVPSADRAGRRTRPSLRVLPTLDSDDLAAQRRAELALDRDVAARLGRSAVAAIEAGTYDTPSGDRVDWRPAVDEAVAAKVSIPPAAAPRRFLGPFRDVFEQVAPTA